MPLTLYISTQSTPQRYHHGQILCLSICALARYKLNTGFSTPQVGIVGAVNYTYVLIYAIYRGQKKSIQQQQDLEVSMTRRELLSDRRGTYHDDDLELEPRAGGWDKVKYVT